MATSMFKKRLGTDRQDCRFQLKPIGTQYLRLRRLLMPGALVRVLRGSRCGLTIMAASGAMTQHLRPLALGARLGAVARQASRPRRPSPARQHGRISARMHRSKAFSSAADAWRPGWPLSFDLLNT